MSKNSAKERAWEVERKILQAIEKGEFTPEVGYLWVDPRLGPCGCLLAAAVAVHRSGIDKGPYGYGPVWLIDDLIRMGVITTEAEGHSLEAGYEGILMYEPPAGFTKEQIQRGPFFEMGRRLRRFHPDP